MGLPNSLSSADFPTKTEQEFIFSPTQAKSLAHLMLSFNAALLRRWFQLQPQRRLLGRPRCRWEDSIKMDTKQMGWEGMDWFIWFMIATYGELFWKRECKWTLGSVKYGDFVALLRNCQHLRKGSAARRWPHSSCPSAQNTAVLIVLLRDDAWYLVLTDRTHFSSEGTTGPLLHTVHTSVLKALQVPCYTIVKYVSDSCRITEKFLMQQTPSPKNSAWNIPRLYYILEIIQSVAMLMAHLHDATLCD